MRTQTHTHTAHTHTHTHITLAHLHPSCARALRFTVTSSTDKGSVKIHAK
uniref:Uncharacterized protein n=1 Tax=Anguilla anguilla TaxID=7936 RepID=A0A0E9Q369_ANGAN